MCVIVTAEAGSIPTISQLVAMSAVNADGAGIAWFDGTELHRFRNRFNGRTFDLIVDHYDYFRSVPFLLHFRRATNGGKRECNTHPFRYEKDGERGYIAHNGVALDYVHGRYASDSRNIISAWQDGEADLSDGTQGKFASISDSGVIRWQSEHEDVAGAAGSIMVSNHRWADASDLILRKAA
ncbi:MAG: class II glutamine amidotransferase [Bifidobacterium crudilactis]|jgi:predicted glutamine amidotransferase|nr:class II glutamine amidotransferase [Bifidobacterium crudilactis]MCI1889922.1 class II glutamine amidotransferase [Bifidobacterium crudilactis]